MRHDAFLAGLRARLAPGPDRPAGGARRPGRVWLVGAGPGDPELLTEKARRALAAADVVLHDRLVDARVLELARRGATRVAVGKRPGGGGWTQEAVNAALVRHARGGAFVVRLKSGDPLVFGRADEELDALEAAGIEYAIVPGVTAATAAAAALGASLTRRGRNHAVGFITAQGARGFAEHDWRLLARPGATFAVYMGVQAARFVQGRLLLHGARGDTPVAVVANATRPEQQILSGDLGALDALLEGHGVRGPAVILVGVRVRPVAAARTVEPHLPARAAVAALP